jgi:hypothetical protein
MRRRGGGDIIWLWFSFPLTLWYELGVFEDGIDILSDFNKLLFPQSMLLILLGYNGSHVVGKELRFQ